MRAIARARYWLALLAGALVLPAGSGALVAQSTADEPFVVEYYYKVRWGGATEFWDLFKKNHLPVLEHQKAMGRILQITAAEPQNHATEDGRWDYRVTLTYRNVAAYYAEDPGRDAWLKQKYPDQEGFRREEQRRFELLLAHWDVPIWTYPLPDKP